MSISNFYLLEILAIVLTIAATFLLRIKWRHQYWKRKGLPYLKPHFPFGNIGNPFKRKAHLAILIRKMYNEFKKTGAKHGGLYSFTKPVYIPIDPDIIKNVMLKDFHSFHDRDFYYNEKDDPISAHLFAISGPKWRNLRTKLTPTFTSGKMKVMFDTLLECANIMVESLRKYEDTKQGVDIKDELERYTIDVIGSCAFGLECNSFKNEDAEFRKYGKSVFKPFSKFKRFLNSFAFSRPNLARKLGFVIFSKEINSFFMSVVKDTIRHREDNHVRRNDMLQLLIDLKNKLASDDENTQGGKELSLNEIAAQVFVFLVAGFETSSTAMSFCLYELATHPDIQRRLRNEINSVLDKHNGNITYEAIMDMKYMEQVIDEALRKYPPLPFLTRMCVEDYHVPGTGIVVEKGTKVFIPTLGLHYDSEYFPNPEKFDPERFSEKNKAAIQPFTYIPFGEGPRICIAMRFGLMQIKVAFTALLSNYVVTLNKKTSIPLEIDSRGFVLSAKGGVWVDIANVHKNKS